MESNEDEILNDEGLKGHYDVIIAGTGMTESMLACIFAKHGLSVLHLDKNGYYGKTFASHSLDSLLSICSDQFHNIPQSSVIKSVKIIDFLDPQQESSHVVENSFISLHTEKTDLIESDNVTPVPIVDTSTSIVGQDTINSDFTSARSDSNKSPSKLSSLLQLSRRFNIDFPACGFIFNSGSTVDFLLKSDVSKYLDFQSIEGLFYLQDSTDTCHLHAVPCSKGDVFKSQLLNPLEKRSLMKFLQVVSDWGRSEEGMKVQHLNETDLAAGRSLHRPQNKDVSSSSSSFVMSNFYEKPLSDLLTHFKLSIKLQQIVTHSLCLQSCSSSSISSIQGLKDLYLHLTSIGIFGDSAFLVPQFGMGELPQALCRMCAVWGGVYILGRSITSFQPKTSETSETATGHGYSVQDSTGHNFTCDKLIFNSDEWPYALPVSITSTVPVTSRRYILSHVGILNSPILPMAKALCIIPPKSAGLQGRNEHAIFVTQLDASTAVVPEGHGFVFLSISTEVTLLTGGIHDTSNANTECIDLMKSLLCLLQASNVKEVGNVKVQQLCYVTSLRPIYSKCEAAAEFEVGVGMHVDKGSLAVCYETAVCITPDGFLEQAKEIFRDFYPDKPFLKEIEVKTRGEGEEGQGDGYGYGEEGVGLMDPETESDFRALELALKSVAVNVNVNVNVITEDQISLGDGDSVDNISCVDRDGDGDGESSDTTPALPLLIEQEALPLEVVAINDKNIENSS